jgi:phage gpG-like protein
MANFIGQGAFEAIIRSNRANAEAEALRACETSARELGKRVQKTLGRGDPRNGHLADTINVFQSNATTWTSSSQEYAAALEFGHLSPDGSRVPAKKFFFPSVKIMNKKHRRRILAWFRKALKVGT